MVRALKWGAIVIGLVVGVAAAIYLPPLRASAGTGAGFVAKQMCSCVFVSDRSFDACRPDMMEVMDDIQAEVEGTGVRASVPLFLVERLATFDEGYGCTLD